jgi:hypothetical protein
MWHAAKLICELAGGHLACIESAQEQKFLVGLANHTQVFIGASDEDEQGKWRWVNGSPFSYTEPWWPGQPDNTNGIEHYLTIESNGLWNDWPNKPTNGGYLCEWE